MGRVYSHLGEEERQVVQALLGQGVSYRGIAKQLGRCVSTISREIKRNVWFPSNHTEAYRQYRPAGLKTGAWTGTYYVSSQAHRKARRRVTLPRKPSRFASDELASFVCEGLRRGWSPLLISGRLRLEYPGNPVMRACPETIYTWVYGSKYRRKTFASYLPRAHRSRRKRTGRRVKGPRIPLRVSMHERNTKIEKRGQMGHWEADTVIYQGACVHTEVERTSRLLKARIIPTKSASDTLKAQYEIFAPLPPEHRKTITCDNGTEFAEHSKLVESLGVLTYFADPYSSWQRGSNENKNGILRRYLPKRTDISTLTQEDLDDIINDINNKPMACLNYHTPNETWSHHTSKLTPTTTCCTSN